MTATGLGDVLERVRSNLVSRRYSNETAVREAIVLPVLQQLGWDIFDTAAVHREYPVRTRRVDYALFSGDKHPALLVEVKAVGGADAQGDTQLFEYAFHEGVQMALLTDGQAWNFYLPMEGGSYGDRRVYQLDLLERSIQECCDAFERYLQFARVKSGSAISDARRDYQRAKNERIAQESLSAAWARLLADPDDALVALLADKAEAICGFAPTPEQTHSFITAVPTDQTITDPARRQREPRQGVAPIGVQTQVPPNRHKTPPVAVPPPGPVRTTTIRATEVVLGGRSQPVRSATEGLVTILRHLGQQDPGFYEKFSRAAPTRTRNHFSARRDDVYPGRPDLIEYTTEVAAGWWLGTNIANREKVRLAKVACEIAGVQFGTDIDLIVPSTD